MRFPPDEWTIRLDELFDPTVGDGSTSKLSAEVLVQVDNTARINGCFKVILSGANTLKLDLPAENLLIMGGAASYRIKMEVKPQDILLRTNATTSEWFDLMDSIQDGSIIVGLSSGGEDSTGALRKQLAKESTKRDPNGAALRWAFGAGPNGGCDLQLQVKFTMFELLNCSYSPVQSVTNIPDDLSKSVSYCFQFANPCTFLSYDGCFDVFFSFKMLLQCLQHPPICKN